MLKKAGIVVAAAAAALLAVSPLAFAGDKGDDHGHRGGSDTVNSVSDDSNTAGIVNVTDNNVNVPVQLCNNDIPIQGGAAQGQVPVKDIAAALSGAVALFGDSESEAESTVTDARTCAQAGEAGDSVEQSND